MHSGFRLAIVLVAGVLVGAFGLVVVLLLSGLEIPAIRRDARDTLGPAQPPAVSPTRVKDAAPGPPTAPNSGVPPRAPQVPRRTTEAGGPLLLLRVGPVPGDVATEIVGELTLAGFTARVKTVVATGRRFQVISVGPHPQAVIDAIAERLRGKFPAVSITATYPE